MPAVTSPRSVLNDLLGERGLAEQDLMHYNVTPEEFKSLMSDQPDMTDKLAEKLHKALGPSAAFWKNLTANYLAGRTEGKPELVISTDEKPPSGNIGFRVPSTLHGRLLKRAKTEGVSLNKLLLWYVSEGLGRAEQGESRV
jgi:antitoxin HicB